MTLRPIGLAVLVRLYLPALDGTLTRLHCRLAHRRLDEVAILVAGEPVDPALAQEGLRAARSVMRPGTHRRWTDAALAAAALGDPLDRERVEHAAGNAQLTWEDDWPCVAWPGNVKLRVERGRLMVRLGNGTASLPATPASVGRAVRLLQGYVELRADAYLDGDSDARLVAAIHTAIRTGDVRSVAEVTYPGALGRLGLRHGAVPEELFAGALDAVGKLAVERNAVPVDDSWHRVAADARRAGRPRGTGALRFDAPGAELLVHDLGGGLTYGRTTYVRDGKVHVERVARPWSAVGGLLAVAALRELPA